MRFKSNFKTTAMFVLLVFFVVGKGVCQTNAWVNELHYQNTGVDSNEAVEIVIENPGNIQDYEILLYDSNGSVYDSETVNNFSQGLVSGNFNFFSWKPSTINNNLGGIALVYQNALIPGQFLSYGGVITATDGIVSGLTSTNIGVSENNMTSAASSLQLRNLGTSYADFTWGTYSSQSFGDLNFIQTFTNSAPFFESISQNPVANNVTSSKSVTVTSRISDSDGLSSVVLKWGTVSGSLSNTITMSNVGSKYTTDSAIPAQTENTTIYYEIEAKDNNSVTAISSLKSYTVLPDNSSGLALNITNHRFLINFDETIANVNNGKFKGNGLQSTPATGQLDSDAFKISGLTNSGTPALFGSSYTSQTKFARGESIGGVSSASGLYAFTVASGNNALGIQPGQGGTEFNPGKIIFRFQNTTGEEITSLSISYKVYAYNDKARSTRVDFYHGASESTLTQETNLNFETPEVADANPKWESTYLKTDLENLSIQNNGVYYLIWNSEDLLPVSTGARDEFALDVIEIIANPTTLTSQLEGLITNIRMDGDIALRTPTYMTGNLSIFNGNFKTNNFLTLKSSATKTASIGDLSNGSITGLVTTERYMSKKKSLSICFEFSDFNYFN